LIRAYFGLENTRPALKARGQNFVLYALPAAAQSRTSVGFCFTKYQIDCKMKRSIQGPGSFALKRKIKVMIECPNCHSPNRDTSRFCEECGTRLVQKEQAPTAGPPPAAEKNPVWPQATDPQPPAYVPPAVSADFGQMRTTGNETRIDIPAIPLPSEPEPLGTIHVDDSRAGAHAVLIIERGDAPGTEFKLVGDDVIIGRWDADNGIFPDVDLDAYDSDAKVSRKHAKIRRHAGAYSIEDLGSTNGTYVNRGRRLLPGNAQALHDGDEVIVGKTFLRFQIVH